MFFHVFLCNNIKVNHFLYRFITLLHLISSFSLTRSLLLSNSHVSMDQAIAFFYHHLTLNQYFTNLYQLISSVKTLCLSLLNLCCVLNTDFFSYEFFMIFLVLSMLIFFYINLYNFFSSYFFYNFIIFLIFLFNYQVASFLNSFYNFQV